VVLQVSKPAISGPHRVFKFPVQKFRLTKPNICVNDHDECRSFKLSLGNSEV
jgi:hypothetical protein